jgi:PPK2 family polyphosphate:nucleotide phosphotransferase
MSQPMKIISPVRLKNVNPNYHEGLDKEKARELTEKLCRRIGELQEMLYADRSRALLIVLQGMDTSGKDGTVKHVFDAVNPAGVETAYFKTPSSEELAHDYLWRVHKVVPRYGNIGVFNRSHYEEALIVRVLDFVPPKVWRKRYDQINAFEKHLAENNVVILKFFLHISKDEQAKRLQARIDDPRKRWKFQLDDLKMRACWDRFQKAYEDVINRCSTPYAPWHVIPANHKWYRNYIVAKIIVNALDSLNLKFPKPKEDLSKIRIK